MSQRHDFSPEEIEYLREGYRRWRFPELTERFNAWSGRALTLNQVRGAVQNRNMRAGRAPGLVRGEREGSVWRPEYLAWLRVHRPRMTLQTIQEEFEKAFGRRMTKGQLEGACDRHGIYAADYRFRPGQAPWNLGKPGIRHPNTIASQFKTGNLPASHRPIYSFVWRGDYWYVKVADTRSDADWWLVHRLVWETEHGPLPAGWVVVFLDGDPHHCLDADNLATVHRRVLGRLNQAGWSELTGLDERRAMLAMLQLTDAARERARSLGWSSKQTARVVPAIRRFER